MVLRTVATSVFCCAWIMYLTVSRRLRFLRMRIRWSKSVAPWVYKWMWSSASSVCWATSWSQSLLPFLRAASGCCIWLGELAGRLWAFNDLTVRYIVPSVAAKRLSSIMCSVRLSPSVSVIPSRSSTLSRRTCRRVATALRTWLTKASSKTSRCWACPVCTCPGECPRRHHQWAKTGARQALPNVLTLFLGPAPCKKSPFSLDVDLEVLVLVNIHGLAWGFIFVMFSLSGFFEKQSG
eukprot:2303301-Amphidinium_carterae.3